MMINPNSTVPFYSCESMISSKSNIQEIHRMFLEPRMTTYNDFRNIETTYNISRLLRSTYNSLEYDDLL
jgi:hypothetical protein